MSSILDEQQQRAFESILRGDNTFVTGPGGCGKSFLVRLAVQRLREEGVEVAVTATTGTAAVNLGVDGARTLDSFLGIMPSKISLEDIVSAHRPFRDRFFDTDNSCLLVDEISMANSERIDLLYELLSLSQNSFFVNAARNLAMRLKAANERSEKNDIERKVQVLCEQYRKTIYAAGYEPKVRVIFLGDLCQLPPVKPGKTEIFLSAGWQKMGIRTATLTTQHRQAATSPLYTALQHLRMGMVSAEVRELVQRCSRPLQMPSVHLYAKNKLRDAHNERALEECRGRALSYSSQDTFTCPDYLRAVYQGQFSYPQVVTLKVGCQVMLLRNLDTERGLVNGSMGTVESLGHDSVTVEFSGGVKETITRESDEVHSSFWNTEIGREVQILQAKRKQIPLTLAYALSIHKSQGQSIRQLTVHCNEIWEVGQLYTAISRATTESGLAIVDFAPQSARVPSIAVRQLYQNAEREVLQRPSTSQVIEAIYATSGRIAKGAEMSQTEFRSALIRLRDGLERKGLTEQLSNNELDLLQAVRQDLGLATNEAVRPNGMFIHCPRCAATLTERHLLLVGLYCGCGKATPAELLEEATNKYRWATYILHDAGSSLINRATYVGVTNRGSDRTQQHARTWIRDMGQYTMRCSLRLGENMALRLFRPTRNILQVGGAKDSDCVRFGAKEGRMCLDREGRFGSLSDPRLGLIRHTKFASATREPHLSSGLIFLTTRRLPVANEICYLEVAERCKCPIPCWLRSIHNELLGRPKHFPLPDTAVRKERRRRTRHVESKEMVIDDVGHNLQCFTAIGTRRRPDGESQNEAKRRVRKSWDRGLFYPGVADAPWRSVPGLMHIMGRRDVRELISDITSVLGKMTTSEHQQLYGHGGLGKGSRCHQIYWDLHSYLSIPQDVVSPTASWDI